MQQQRRRDLLDQPIFLDQLERFFVALGHMDRQPPNHSRDQPHAALPDRIVAINLVILRVVRSDEPRLIAASQPSRDKRPHRRRALAPEPPHPMLLSI